ncbi:hypothetical protein LCGC14_1637820 [marine sediment metagenome]|uniref:Uncharacterized protein n=1 Tax=marine sediment metagenome TaxID=412755 RepID=A0A0F9L019_9ZZZZ
MTDDVQVKFCVSTHKTNYTCVCSCGKARKTIEEIKNPVTLWVQWSGRVNDIDSNESEFCIRSEEIVSTDIIAANNL